MKIRVLLLIITCYSTPSVGDEVSQGEIAAYVLTGADWLFTRRIREHKKDGVYERNTQLCGKHPSEACTARWMLGKAAIVYLFNHHYPIRNHKIFGVKVKSWFNFAYNATHLHATAINIKVTIRLHFR